MEGLISLRNTMRDFLRKYDEIAVPVFRFVVSLIMFLSIKSMFGYSDLFNKGIVIFLLAVICALSSDIVAVLLGGLDIFMNCLQVSLEVGILFFILMVIIYCTYMRLFPKSGVILAIVPVMFMLHLEFAVPLVVLIFAGVTGIIPSVFGIVIYYFSVYTKEAFDTLRLEEAEKDFSAYTHIIESISKNKAIIVIGITYAVVIMVCYFIYRMKIDYSWYISIGVGAVLTLLVSLICSSVVDMGDNSFGIGSVFLGAVIGTIVAAFIQYVKGIVDYAKKETVQFEDDEYYYYVTAIPKHGAEEAIKKNDAIIKERIARDKEAAAIEQKTRQQAQSRQAAQQTQNRQSMQQPQSRQNLQQAQSRQPRMNNNRS